MKTRLHYMDIAKAIIVIMMIIYHVLAPCFLRNAICGVVGYVMFAMFFISGYFHKSGKRSIGQNIKTRFIGVLKPFFIYSIVMFVLSSVYYLATKQESIMDVLCCLRNFYGGCIWNRTIQDLFGWDYHHLGATYLFLSPLWFLLTMFFSGVLFYFIEGFALKSKLRSIIIALVLAVITGVCVGFNVSLPYNLQTVPVFTSAILLGALCGQNSFFENIKINIVLEWVIDIVVLVSIGVYGYFYSQNVQVYRGIFGDKGAKDVVVYFIFSVLLSLTFCDLCKLIERSKIRIKELSWVGENSLYIYMTHVFFGWILSIPMGISLKYNVDGIDTPVMIKSVILTILTIIVTVLYTLLRNKIFSKK